MQIDERLFKIAYKKLKSNIYYDKSQTILRDRLVRFETEREKQGIDSCLEDMAAEFLDTEKRNKMEREILRSISYYTFPKKLKDDNKDINSKDVNLIRNYTSKEIEVDKLQYYIDMDIRGHVLGVVWLLLIGQRIDREIYEDSYGNRIRKNLLNELSEAPTFSPYLFEPYFQQYESWRDKAMDQALHNLHSGHDVVVITLDFERFFYSVDISKELMDGIYDDVIKEMEEEEEIEESQRELLKDLNDFIYRIIKRYATCSEQFNNLKVLPIGFLPSNVLANYALRNFDRAILNGWNPIYFGRYVDDILVVDKIESNSDLYRKAKRNELTANDIIRFFLAQCSGWNGLNGTSCDYANDYALFTYKNGNEEGNGQSDEEGEPPKNPYVLNKLYNPHKNDNSRLVVQNDKVKIFYFSSEESDALITCFRENIAKNKSEFRHMPEDEAIFQKDDYSEIYDLQNNETINKFRGISGISIDKFELSKLLGKYLRIGGLIQDSKERKFDNQIDKIFNNRVIIDNFSVWEKVIEILVINESFVALRKFVKKIVGAIRSLKYDDDKDLRCLKKSLLSHLRSALTRSLALVWGDEIDDTIEKLCNCMNEEERQNHHFSLDEINEDRVAYCLTRMVDKSVMPIFIDMLDMDSVYWAEDTVNLTHFRQVKDICKEDWDEEYRYYPFLVTMYDFSMMTCVQELEKRKTAFSSPVDMYEKQVKSYVSCNYDIPDYVNRMNQLIQIDAFDKKDKSNKQAVDKSKKQSFLISVGNEKKDKLKLAIANVRLNHNNFKRVVKDDPNRSYERYLDISKIINQAIDENSDMVIMPEAFMPFEWLPTVARTCSRNNLAVVTGVEHVKFGNRVYNLTAVILPYDDLMNKSAFISFHLKTHYAPSEKQEINGYRLKVMEGGRYELYKWADCYFPVYCCYELTSITERAIFQSYADFLVAIEWNRDVNYYSNILESLSRDIHCYCVQVNSSDYGDSRITKPSKTEDKDILRTKGGANSTILVDEINIGNMRDFQFKEYELQDKDSRFKPTPPGFDPNIVLRKIKGEKLI